MACVVNADLNFRHPHRAAQQNLPFNITPSTWKSFFILSAAACRLSFTKKR
jgi:hypothetical protein